MKVAIIARDSLSIVNFARWFAQEFKNTGVSFVTIGPLEPFHRQDIRRLATRHVELKRARFVGPLGDALYILQLWRILTHERFDMVWTFGTKPNVIASIVARFAGVRRIIIGVRGRATALGNQSSMAGKVLRAALRHLYKRACQASSRVWFTNKYDREYFVSTGLVSESKTFVTEELDDGVLGPEVLRECGLVRMPSTESSARYRLGPATVVLISPDALSVRLFCTRIIREFQRIPGTRVVVVSNAGEHQRDLDALGVISIQVPVRRFMDPFGDMAFVWTLYRLLRRERADVVFNMSTKPNIYGTMAARLAGVPEIVSYVVGLGAGFLVDDRLRQRALSRTMVALYTLACRWSNRVWFTNPNDRAFFVDNRIVRPEKTVLTRFYLDLDGYAPTAVPREEMEALRRDLGVSERDSVVVMVARMIWPKGIREFAEAAELLAESHPYVRFLLVAPLETGSAHAVPESYIREKERSANLTWLGFRNDVRTVYAIADIAVLPSYYREGGYPRALTEPMAMGKPLVTTVSEHCRAPVDDGKNGYLVPIKDAHALADAIRRLIERPDLRAAFGRHSREKAVLEYDERKIVAEAFELLGFDRLGWSVESTGV